MKMRKDYQYIRNIKIEGKKVYIYFTDRENLEISSIWFYRAELEDIMHQVEETHHE